LPASEGNYCSNNTGRRKSGMRHKITEFLDWKSNYVLRYIYHRKT
jgi:hypothetical protein